ncbi:MAG: ABC transporter ATP-binding protein [Desulfobulbaceae bacterium]|nr:ABC transporter ATP-binding protein [Desulfobulbaceae bacterium]
MSEGFSPAISVKDLTKSFGDKVVVKKLSLQVEQGEIFGFLGPNGSGKTTFIRMLCGLLRPDSGSGICLGYNIVSESAKIKPNIGYMSQKFSLYEDLSVRENLNFMGRMYGIPRQRLAVAEIMEHMGLSRFAEQLAGTLSGGWKQRLALASCLLHKPKLLLLDEPTAGVDPKARRDFWDDVYSMAALGITALISTHYMDEAERCHRLAYLSYGNLLAVGTADEVTASSGLATWSISGKKMHELSAQIKALPGVELVIPFGNTLHVCGHDELLLSQSLHAMKNSEYRLEKIATGLEEVFISLMQDQGDS